MLETAAILLLCRCRCCLSPLMFGRLPVKKYWQLHEIYFYLFILKIGPVGKIEIQEIKQFLMINLQISIMFPWTLQTSIEHCIGWLAPRQVFMFMSKLTNAWKTQGCAIDLTHVRSTQVYSEWRLLFITFIVYTCFVWVDSCIRHVKGFFFFKYNHLDIGK